MVNGFIDAGHHLDADDGRQVFLVPVLLGGGLECGAGLGRLQQGQRFGVAAHLDALGRVDGADRRQKFGSCSTRHQQPFSGVAGAVLLGLGVVSHVHGHGHVAKVIDIHMAVAVQVFDDRHFGVAADALNQTLAAARNDDVDKLRHGDQHADGFAVGAGHQLHRVGRQTGSHQCLLHQRGQRLVRFNRF